jgi:hypothetical protein
MAAEDGSATMLVEPLTSRIFVFGMLLFNVSMWSAGKGRFFETALVGQHADA